MGCFLPCFGGSKHRKSRENPDIVPSADQKHGNSGTPQPTKPIKQEVENIIEPIVDSKGVKLEDQLDGNIRKKVTFDLNVKTCEEEFPTQKIKNSSVKSQNEGEKERERKEENQRNESKSLSDSSMSSVFSYPPSHRYHNCTSSDDDQSEAMEIVEIVSEEIQESESLFSLSIESRKQVTESELGEKEVNSPMPIHCPPDQELESMIGFNQSRSGKKFLNSVLNPVENITQWKAVKARKMTPSDDQEKENMNFEEEICIPFSEEPRIKSSKQGSEHRSDRRKPNFDEIAVDTSLSSWLDRSETTPISKNSPNSVENSSGRGNSSRRSYEDRPILGALTVEEIRQISPFSSPRRKSPSRSPDEMPIIGTVGSYWNHTRRELDSDSDSDSGSFRKQKV